MYFEYEKSQIINEAMYELIELGWLISADITLEGSHGAVSSPSKNTVELNVSERELFDLATDSMMLYGVNINLQRALPNVYDGMKPIHRRILYMIWKLYRDKYTKVASSIGDVLHLSPHGDQGMGGIYARLAQPFSNNSPLLTPDGNPGTPTTGRDYAAPRYWDVCISKFALDVLFKEFDGKVNMVPNYDNTEMEPLFLPARFPIILLNGVTGIAYTMSCDIPPYSVNDVADATLKLLEKPESKIRLVPDSPTGCDVMVRSDDSFMFQSSFEVDNRSYTITIKNTPYGKYLRDIQKALYEIQDSNNPIPEIQSADDECDFTIDKFAFVIRCKPCNLYTVINTLFSRVPGFRSVVSTKNMIVVDNEYRTHEYDIRQILLNWIQIRLVEKRNWFLRELVEKTRTYNMLEGKAFLLNKKNIEKTIKIFRNSKTRADIVPNLVKAYPNDLTTSQANYVQDAHLYQLTEEEYNKTIDKMNETDKQIKELREIISDPENIKKKIAEDINEIKNKYGTPRKSKILNQDNTERNNIGVVQILTDGSIVFSETENPDHLSSDVSPVSGDKVCLIDDKAQFLWVDTTKVQHNKPLTLTSIGKCVMGKCMCVCSNMSNDILMLTNQGRIKCMAIGGIPSNLSKKPLIPLNPNEEIVSVLELNDESQDVLIYTKDGMGKRIKTSDLWRTSINSQGQFIIKDVDNVSGMFWVNNNKPLLVYVTILGRTRVNKLNLLKEGKKFGELKPIIKLSPQDDLIAVFCADPQQAIKLQHADGRVSTVNISSLDVVTMSTPPSREKHVPGVKVVRAVLS